MKAGALVVSLLGVAGARAAAAQPGACVPDAQVACSTEPSASAQAAERRRGLRLAGGISAGDTAAKYQGIGISPELGFNYGVAPAFDLRFGGRLMLSNTEIGFIALAGVPVSARFNLGSTFSLGLGGFVGVRNAISRPRETGSGAGERERETGLAAGPEVFPAILRLGAKRDLEVGLVLGALFAVTSSSDRGYGEVIHAAVNVTYLRL
jgi:hypothetical protein